MSYYELRNVLKAWKWFSLSWKQENKEKGKTFPHSSFTAALKGENIPLREEI